MKLKICLMGLLCLIFKVSAQNINTNRPLKVGDTVPELIISNFVNYDRPSIKLSDFKDKLLILDFWSTSCGSCIAMFPKEVELQNKYKDSIKFLLVDSKNTRDNRERVIRFFDTYHPSYKKLASVVDDTVLSQYFPHESVGYYVWIKNNVVRAITDDQEYNMHNIEDFLAGKHPILNTAKFIHYDERKPIFLNDNGGEAPNYLYRTILASYKKGLHSSFRFIVDSNGNCTGYHFINFPRKVFYGAAYPDLGNAVQNRIILKIDHPEEFSADSASESWKSKNVFTYEATFPPMSKAMAIKFLRDELDRYFHFKVNTEYRDTTCYVVKAGSNLGHNDASLQPLPDNLKTETFLRDFPISSIVRSLNGHSRIPFVDESGYSGSIRLPFEYTDLTIDDIVNKLKSKGLTVEKSTRRLKFCVVSQGPATY